MRHDRDLNLPAGCAPRSTSAPRPRSRSSRWTSRRSGPGGSGIRCANERIATTPWFSAVEPISTAASPARGCPSEALRNTEPSSPAIEVRFTVVVGPGVGVGTGVDDGVDVGVGDGVGVEVDVGVGLGAGPPPA
jgi:hypothetical protein